MSTGAVRRRSQLRLADGLVAYLVTCFGCGCVVPFAHGQAASDQQTLTAMWQRGLTESAINYAKARVRTSSDGGQQARWLGLLMECYAQAALRAATPAEAEELWSNATAVEVDYANASPADPRLPWLAWQAARCQLLQAQAALAQFLAAPANNAFRERTLTRVREVLASTKELSEALEKRIPLAAREGFQNERQAPVQELHRLGVDVSLLECEALLVRMRVYQSGSPDRIAAATEIVTRTATAATRSGGDAASRDLIAIAQAIADLEFGDRDASLSTLERLASEGTTQTVRIRSATSAIDWLAGQGDATRAEQVLRQLAIAPGSEVPELELARIQIALANLQTSPEANRDPTVNALVQRAQSLGDRFGEYWRNRAEAMLIAGGGETAGLSASPELMLAEIRQLLASGNEERAIARLLEFRDAEAEAERGENAIMLASQAAALLQRQERWSESIAAIESPTLRFANLSSSAKAHRLAVWGAAQSLRSDASEERIAQYESAMLRQLRMWPNAVETDEVTRWLTDWLVGKRRRHELVIELANRGLATTSADMASQAFSQWLGQVFRLTQEQRFQAIEAFQQAIDKSTSANRTAAGSVHILAETLHRWSTAEQLADLQERLSRMEREANPIAPQNGNTALANAAIQAAQLVMAARRSDREFLRTEASSNWPSYPWPESIKAAILLALVEALDELPADEQVAWVNRIGLDKNWLTSILSQPEVLDQSLAWRWLAWLEGPDEALVELQSQVDAHPADGRLRLLLAQLHVSRGTTAYAESTRLARFVAANTPAGSDLNLAARWQVCKNLIQQGEQQAAREAAELLLAAQPLPPSIWRDRFDRLTK